MLTTIYRDEKKQTKRYRDTGSNRAGDAITMGRRQGDTSSARKGWRLRKGDNFSYYARKTLLESVHGSRGSVSHFVIGEATPGI